MYKVFLAEDEIVVREGIRNSGLWDDGRYTLVGDAPDGELALSMIQETKPDILITDIRMPFMDGLALSRIVKISFPWIKIIILSGHDEFEYAREAISIGIDEYLLKPVSVQEMLAVMDKLSRKIDAEREELLSIADLKARIKSTHDLLREKDGKNGFDPASLLNIKGDVFLTKLKFSSKKDIDGVVEEYLAILGKNIDDNPLLAYFLFGEIIVSASKLAESLGGDIREIAPFSLSSGSIQEIISSPAAFSGALRSFLYALVEFRDSHSGGRYQSVIVKAKEYIDNNFNTAQISLYTTAEYVGISPNHLSSVFARETGENFIEYLTRVRIERAKLLLKTTAMKSIDIANETGFSDPHYFSYIFKKNTGLSPREYRVEEQNREKTNQIT